MEQPSSLLLRGSTRVSYKLSLLLVFPLLVALTNNSIVYLISLELEPKVFLLEILWPSYKNSMVRLGIEF
jgi:hypothetical protein